jgi:hypothetical protein
MISYPELWILMIHMQISYYYNPRIDSCTHQMVSIQIRAEEDSTRDTNHYVCCDDSQQ